MSEDILEFEVIQHITLGPDCFVLSPDYLRNVVCCVAREVCFRVSCTTDYRTVGKQFHTDSCSQNFKDIAVTPHEMHVGQLGQGQWRSEVRCPDDHCALHPRMNEHAVNPLVCEAENKMIVYIKVRSQKSPVGSRKAYWTLCNAVQLTDNGCEGVAICYRPRHIGRKRGPNSASFSALYISLHLPLSVHSL